MYKILSTISRSHYSNDQDILNALLYNQKVLIDIKWNVQDDFYRNNRYTSPAWKPSYTDAILHPIILHYSGRKPWAYHAMHPLRHLFSITKG